MSTFKGKDGTTREPPDSWEVGGTVSEGLDGWSIVARVRTTARQVGSCMVEKVLLVRRCAAYRVGPGFGEPHLAPGAAEPVA